ncbi:MAG: phosphopyruvate hydratase [Candidatus Nealsonbacteria bacterium]
MKSSLINSIKAREVLDSRGNPTIEVDLKTNLGSFLASVPSGASTGKYEAMELRDGGKRYFGKGVLRAVKNINEIINPELKGKDLTLQKEIDELMIKLDGTDNKSRLGANAICAVSLAVCRAGAKAKKLELFQYIKEIAETLYKIPATKYKIPFPSFNIINGGVHAGNNLDIQEFMVIPQRDVFSENLKVASEIYHQLKILLSKKYGKQAVNLGDEGGFAPPLLFAEQALEIILEAARTLNYEKEIKIILDIAASQFFEEGKYKMKIGIFTREGLKRYYLNLISKYPIIGLEDPFSEDDWEGFREITKGSGKEFLVIGDDLLVTNSKRIKEAKEKDAVNAVILKINQIGTVSEAFEAAKLAKDFGWKIIVSHRSGETNDDFIADFAVGIGADFIKTGAPARGERVAKYNRLLKIEEEI